VIRTDGCWNIEGWPLPEEWAALWGFLTLIVTIVAATVALLQFGSYIREREERARPYLQADFEFRSILLDVVVKNISGSPATNVSITADPPIESTLADRTAVLSHVTSNAYRISQLAPGRDIRWFLDRAPDYYDDKTKPRQYTVTLSYDDPRATRPRRRWQFWRAKLQGHYVEAFTLDIEQWGEASAEQDYDNQNWNINKRNEQVLRNIGQSLQRIEGHLTTPPPAPTKRPSRSASTKPVASRRASRIERKPADPENPPK
jgi:hypothetical protein